VHPYLKAIPVPVTNADVATMQYDSNKMMQLVSVSKIVSGRNKLTESLQIVEENK
jgi:hypothetical protein